MSAPLYVSCFQPDSFCLFLLFFHPVTLFCVFVSPSCTICFYKPLFPSVMSVSLLLSLSFSSYFSPIFFLCLSFSVSVSFSFSFYFFLSLYVWLCVLLLSSCLSVFLCLSGLDQTCGIRQRMYLSRCKPAANLLGCLGRIHALILFVLSLLYYARRRSAGKTFLVCISPKTFIWKTMRLLTYFNHHQFPNNIPVIVY